MLVIGVDPGVSGAFCLIDSESGATRIWNLKGKDLEALKQELRGSTKRPRVFIETPFINPRNSRKSIASQFERYGEQKALLTLLPAVVWDIEEVEPKVWKRHFFNPEERDDKEASVALAKLLAADYANLITRHDRAEAFLIAKYGVDSI